MDDLQFRRSIYADPNSQDKELLTATQSEPSRKQFAQEIKQLDQKITQALNVPVPDDLANKLILRQTLASHQQHKRKTRIHLALAACVAITAGFIINLVSFSSSYNNLGDYALAHVYHEKSLLSNDIQAQISLTSLNEKMASFDGSFSQSLGKLLFADYCRFDGMSSLHLVFKGKSSPVTVFIVPKNNQLIFNSHFTDQTLVGEALDFKKANVIVVADKNESLSQWKKNLSENISWSI